MPPDADGLQCMKPFLPLPLSSGVSEQLGVLFVVALQDHVRDQLLVRRIVLHDAPGPEGLIAAIQKSWQISVNGRLKT